jgi:hypothetical protein
MMANSMGAQDRAHADTASVVRPGRLVGVLDYDTGQPVVGARVLDMRSGSSAVTTSTGTLTLFFVDSTGSLVQVAKLGYEPQRFFAANSDRDTAAITVLLRPSATSLPAVVTRGKSTRGVADTVRALELNGFYDRRAYAGAPASAFITADKISKLSLLADLVTLSGRDLCYTNLFINGIKVEVPSRIAPGPRGARAQVGPPMRDRLDAMLDPSEVLAVEMYRTADAPAEFNSTQPSRCGVTLIWTK